MVKELVLQQGYGLSDPELERQVVDRLSFNGSSASPRPCPTTPPSGSSGNASPSQVKIKRSGRSYSANSTRETSRSRRAPSRTPRSSPPTRGMPRRISHREERRRRGGVGMVLGPRRGAGHTIGSSCTPNRMWAMASSGIWRLLQPTSTIAECPSPSRVRWFIGIRDSSE